MYDSQPFEEVFPTLVLDEKITELMRYVNVNRIVMNQEGSRLRVYITSDNWLKKSHIYKIEEAIASQIFGEGRVEVKIIERFHLSSSYTPKLFYETYRNSMLRELKTVSPLLHQTFLHASLEFKPGIVHATIPIACLSEKRRQELSDYLTKIFCERAGFADEDVQCEYIEQTGQRRLDEEEIRIEEKVRSGTAPQPAEGMGEA